MTGVEHRVCCCRLMVSPRVLDSKRVEPRARREKTLQKINRASEMFAHNNPRKVSQTTTTTTTTTRENTIARQRRATKRASELKLALAICSILLIAGQLPFIQCQGSRLARTNSAETAAAATEAKARAHTQAQTLDERAAGTQNQNRVGAAIGRLFKRSPAALPLSSEQRVSGSKSEPPSRPSVDWSKQKPYFGLDMVQNVSVELGKTAYLTCKVYELGDKIVSWLRPRENEILTAGKYTYIGDQRFSSMNDNGSPDWVLEIKDVGINDSTGYECQVSTDPKMSTIINLHVKASKARIKQGEQYHTSLGSTIEFTCEILSSRYYPKTPSSAGGVQQTYWYFNGNLLNYAKAHQLDKSFSIDWDPVTQTSRFKLHNVQLNDAGNYTCKPTSAEPTTIRLHVKKHSKNGNNRAQYSNGYHSLVGNKEAQRNRQHSSAADGSGSSMELADSSASSQMQLNTRFVILSSCLLTFLLLLI